MNTCSQYAINTFGDNNVYEDLKKFHIREDGNAEMNLDHFIIHNLESWDKSSAAENFLESESILKDAQQSNSIG